MVGGGLPNSGLHHLYLVLSVLIRVSCYPQRYPHAYPAALDMNAWLTLFKGAGVNRLCVGSRGIWDLFNFKNNSYRLFFLLHGFNSNGLSIDRVRCSRETGCWLASRSLNDRLPQFRRQNPTRFGHSGYLHRMSGSSAKPVAHTTKIWTRKMGASAPIFS